MLVCHKKNFNFCNEADKNFLTPLVMRPTNPVHVPFGNLLPNSLSIFGTNFTLYFKKNIQYILAHI